MLKKLENQTKTNAQNQSEIGNRQDMLPDGATISNHADKK